MIPQPADRLKATPAMAAIPITLVNAAICLIVRLERTKTEIAHGNTRGHPTPSCTRIRQQPSLQSKSSITPLRRSILQCLSSCNPPALVLCCVSALQRSSGLLSSWLIRVLHGVSRDASDFVEASAKRKLPDKHACVLLIPEVSTAAFPGKAGLRPHAACSCALACNHLDARMACDGLVYDTHRYSCRIQLRERVCGRRSKQTGA